MRVRRTRMYLLAVSLWVCGVHASSDGKSSVPFPAGYRTWVHVKSSVVGPQSESFARNGGLHHFYANGKAVKGYRSGSFPDGAVLVDERLQTREEKGNTLEGALVSVAVMVKDGRRHRDTGGWGFEVFRGDNRSTGALTDETRAACFACHGKMTGHDSVFSELRP